MKKVFAVFTILLVLNASEFDKQATIKPQLVQSGKDKTSCKICGMNLIDYYKTSYIAVSKDRKNTQYCSIRCLSANQNNIDVKMTQVVDVKTQKYILANKAYFVVGSKVAGTMSKVSKLAFEHKKDAQEFIKNMGGELKTFDQAFKQARADFEAMKKKNAAMLYPMGKKLYNEKCQKDKFDLKKYKSMHELKPDVLKYCVRNSEMKGCKCGINKRVHAVSKYLWDKVINKQDVQKITIKKDDKCPVCGMFVSKYPKWVASVDDKRFDGAKDMAKYILEHKNFKKALVSDYYSLQAIDALNAFFVIGSDVFGPMGHELVPFKSKSDAKTFLKEHKGKEILTLKQVTKQILATLDGHK